MTKVMDLRTGEYVAEYSCTPKEAVRAAFAQFDRKDFNTWQYAERYPITRNKHSVTCGDYTALTGKVPA